eukprot:1279481-Rhodomonas_salina.1
MYPGTPGTRVKSLTWYRLKPGFTCKIVYHTCYQPSQLNLGLKLVKGRRNFFASDLNDGLDATLSRARAGTGTGYPGYPGYIGLDEFWYETFCNTCGLPMYQYLGPLPTAYPGTRVPVPGPEEFRSVRSLEECGSRRSSYDSSMSRMRSILSTNTGSTAASRLAAVLVLLMLLVPLVVLVAAAHAVA